MEGVYINKAGKNKAGKNKAGKNKAGKKLIQLQSFFMLFANNIKIYDLILEREK